MLLEMKMNSKPLTETYNAVVDFLITHNQDLMTGLWQLNSS